MQGIGPGTILSGRYTAEHRTAAYQGAEQWTARDATLDRAVLLLAVRRGHPNVDAVLDAARRSAGLDNVRLSRILDVGSDGELAYIVEEALEGSHTISELLAAGPLPAPEVRRIVGETSLVLDVARHRGLHHQQLTPDLVLRTPDGDVKVRGLATMAALAGVDDIPDREAARTDAIAVVALAYAGFTGTWPLPGASGGLPPAPRMANHVAAPSELAGGVPADLDALCRLTFANNQGPTTPGDFARQIAPWSPIPVMLPTITSQSPQHESPIGSPAEFKGSGDHRSSAEREITIDSPAGAAITPDETLDDERRAEPAHEERPVPAGSDAEDVREDTREVTWGRDDREGRDDRDDTADPGTDERPDSGALPMPGTGPGAVPVAHRIPSSSGARPAEASRPRPAPPGARPMAPGSTSPKGPHSPVEPAASLGPSPVATTAAKTAAAFGAAGAATASAAKSLSDRFSGWSSDTRGRARLKVEELKERREEAAAQRAVDDETRAVQAGDLAEQEPYDYEDDAYAYAGRPVGSDVDDRLEPPLPLLPPSAADPLTRDQSRLAVGIIVGFLVVALALAVWGLSKLPSSLPGLTSSDGSTSIASPTTPETESESEDGTATSDDEDGGTVTEAAAAGQPLEFSGVVDYDPLGGGDERPEELPLILDGDESTFWGSEGYRDSTFSGLKAGVGVILDLGAESSISSVDLVLPTTATGELYVTSDEAFFSNRPALSEEMEPAGTFSGEGSVTSELADGTSGRYVVVWFTEISQEGDWYRARLAAASATS